MNFYLPLPKRLDRIQKNIFKVPTKGNVDEKKQKLLSAGLFSAENLDRLTDRKTDLIAPEQTFSLSSRLKKYFLF